MSMGRPRDKGNKDLPDGLYAPYKGIGSYRMLHPVTGKLMSLRTNDKGLAIERYWHLKRHYEPKIREMLAERSLRERGQTISQAARDYRLNHLPHARNKDGSKLNKSTSNAYKNYLKNIEADLRKPVALFGDVNEGPRLVREYLSPWLNQPASYNYRKGLLSRLFNHLIDTGMLQRNPCNDVSNRTKRKDETYIEDNHYLAITSRMAKDWHEVYAMACDWIYVVSGRNSNMLEVKDKDCTPEAVSYYASKNKQPVVVDTDEEIWELVQWFRQYKKDQNIVSPYLIVHPMSARRGLATQPITNEHLYRYFKKAMRREGLSGYTLRHLRPKALTDEAVIAGKPTNKGAHKTDRMRGYYVKKVLPVRVKNNLIPPRKRV